MLKLLWKAAKHKHSLRRTAATRLKKAQSALPGHQTCQVCQAFVLKLLYFFIKPLSLSWRRVVHIWVTSTPVEYVDVFNVKRIIVYQFLKQNYNQLWDVVVGWKQLKAERGGAHQWTVSHQKVHIRHVVWTQCCTEEKETMTDTVPIQTELNRVCQELKHPCLSYSAVAENVVESNLLMQVLLVQSGTLAS